MAPHEFNVVLRTTTDEFNVLPRTDVRRDILGSWGFHIWGFWGFISGDFISGDFIILVETTEEHIRGCITAHTLGGSSRMILYPAHLENWSQQYPKRRHGYLRRTEEEI